MNTKQNANLSISPQVIAMLGRKLYSNHPLVIVVRELLQNSVDACKRKGVNPDIIINIDIDNNKEEINVSCTDNGEGMTEDVLLNKFLCLGESGKRDDNKSTGGFGIAKASIMSNPFWDVHTHDMYVSVDTLGLPPQRVEYIDGTIVNVRITEQWYLNTIKSMLSMIYFSDVSIKLNVIQNGENLISDDNAGLTEVLHNDFIDSDNRYTIDVCKEFENVYHFAKFNAFRLNGLVQFTNETYDRKINLVIDLYTDKLPTDKEYPLSMSRESIESGVKYDIQSKIKEYDENPLTSQSLIYSGENEENLKKSKGLTIFGAYNDPNKNYMTDNNRQDFNFALFANLPAIGKLDTIVVYREDDNMPSTEEKRILRLWAGILALTCDISDEFGIGITGERGLTAERCFKNNNYYYLLNTESILSENLSMDALVHRLHFLATHESLHHDLHSHNEYFTTGMDNIYVATIQKILDNMPKLRAIVRNNYK